MSSPAGPNGFAIVDKEAGWTSHDVVARARKLLNTRKVGHGGTLDPPATGVLVLGVGRGTKLLRFITELPKTYVATFRLGTETTTLDAEGEVTASHDMAGVDLQDVRRAAATFVGDIEQIPPMVSAVKVGGKRLHELARAGVEVERKPRPVTIHELRIDATPSSSAGDVEADAETVGERRYESDAAQGGAEAHGHDFVMVVTCSSGTYIRTLAADIGAALGGGAHVRDLRRTAIGPFDESMARPLEQIELLSLADGLVGRPVVVVGGDTLAAIGHGKVLPRDLLDTDADGPWAIVDETGALQAVYESHKGDTVKPAVVVAPAG